MRLLNYTQSCGGKGKLRGQSEGASISSQQLDGQKVFYAQDMPLF